MQVSEDLIFALKSISLSCFLLPEEKRGRVQEETAANHGAHCDFVKQFRPKCAKNFNDNDTQIDPWELQ